MFKDGIGLFSDNSNNTNLTLYFILYVACRGYFSTINIDRKLKLFYYVGVSILIIHLGLFVLLLINSPNKTNSYYIPNNSLFGVILAVISIYIFGALLRDIKRGTQTIGTLILRIILGVLALILMIFANGRAGWIGFVAGLSFVLFHFVSHKRLRQIILIGAITSIITLLIVFISIYKERSSNGRLLIYKISQGIVNEDNFFYGIGFGRFKYAYLLEQAEYFRRNNIDNEEALLADNTYYAFNEYWQLFIETGFIGLFLLCLALFWLTKHIIHVLSDVDSKALYLPIVGCLICFLITGFFTYTFQVTPICILVILSLSFVTSSRDKKNESKIGASSFGLLLKSLLLITGLVVMIDKGFEIRNKFIARDALLLSRSGFKSEALRKYELIQHSGRKDGNLYFSYAKELYYHNKLELANNIINQTKSLISSNEVYQMSGKIKSELGDLKSAESDLKMAVYMVPNRILSRFNLMIFHLELTRDTSKALVWARLIANMPVKFRSAVTDKVKERAIFLINSR